MPLAIIVHIIGKLTRVCWTKWSGGRSVEGGSCERQHLSTQTRGSQRGRERCVRRRWRDLGDWWRLRPQKISASSWQNKGFGITRTTNQSNSSMGTAYRHPGQDLRPFLELWGGRTSVVSCNRLFLLRRNSEDKTCVGWDPNGRLYQSVRNGIKSQLDATLVSEAGPCTNVLDSAQPVKLTTTDVDTHSSYSFHSDSKSFTFNTTSNSNLWAISQSRAAT